eukprot:3044491-Prorocentrum_lima.AAC.1
MYNQSDVLAQIVGFLRAHMYIGYDLTCDRIYDKNDSRDDLERKGPEWKYGTSSEEETLRAH